MINHITCLNGGKCVSCGLGCKQLIDGVLGCNLLNYGNWFIQYIGSLNGERALF